VTTNILCLSNCVIQKVKCLQTPNHHFHFKGSHVVKPLGSSVGTLGLFRGVLGLQLSNLAFQKLTVCLVARLYPDILIPTEISKNLDVW
jgi:hypothetical protein